MNKMTFFWFEFGGRRRLGDNSLGILRDCSAFLGKLVPYIIQLMMDNPNVLWGNSCYPVVDAD